jgi:hypothetical protein
VHQELPTRPDLEHYRKQAKALARAYSEREAGAVARAEAVLGSRARERFQLSDAQYVLAVEHGCSSWAELKRACERPRLEALAEVERGEIVLRSDLRYTEGEPVDVFVKKRLHRYAITDQANAVRLAGKSPGWLETAGQVVEDFSLNVNRRGVVCVGTVYPRMLDKLTARIAETSLAVYEALLELDD